MSSLRVGYLIQHGTPDLSVLAGPQLHILAVIRELKRAGHQVRLLAGRDASLTWSDDLETWHAATRPRTSRGVFRAVEAVVRRSQSATRFPYFNLFESLRYADACRTALDGCDVLYERNHYLAYGGYFAARAMGIPWVIELNGNILHELDEVGVEMSSLQRSVGRWVTSRAYHAADHIVVVSEALKEVVVRELGVPESRVSVVLNGVDLDLFTRAHDTAGIRRRLGLADGPVVAFVGTFQPWHGADLLVDAFHHVRQQVPDAQLVLIGDGPGREGLVGRVASHGDAGHVRMPGRLPQAEVAAALACADVLVAPHAYAEGNIVGTPLKILEYMAAGRAVVASTAPIHELVEHGVSGHRVAPGDARALADGLVTVLGDAPLRARYAEAARGVAERHSWAAVAGRLEGLFERVRRESSGPALVRA